MLQKSRQFYKIICKTTIHTLHLIIHDKKEERKKYTYIQVFEADINDALGHKKNAIELCTMNYDMGSILFVCALI